VSLTALSPNGRLQAHAHLSPGAGYGYKLYALWLSQQERVVLEVLMTDILEAIKQVNDRLLKGEPHNITENKYNSYASSGYKSQSIVDALNCEMGIGMWGFEETDHSLVYDIDNKPTMALSTVKVWIAGVDAQFSAHGQCSIPKGDIGDAQKGAVTDGLKKALSYYSIGNRAFHGLLSTQKGGSGK
jgi:hypothetical protein